MAASGGVLLRLALAACFLSLTAPEVSRTKPSSGSTYVLDIPTDFHQRVKAFDDFVELIQLPTYVASEFDVSVSYRSRGLRLITLEVISIGIQGQETVEYSTHEYIFEQTREKKTLTFHVHLRDTLVFCENRALGIFPDLHVEKVFVDVTLTALGVPVRAGDPDSVHKNDQRGLALVPSLRRPQKPGFSFPWIWHMLAYEERKIRKCNALNDMIDIVSIPLALGGQDSGVKRQISPLTWPEKVFAEIDSQAQPRFTIATWLYLQEYCPEADLCAIVHHRKNDYMTPVLAVTQKGQFHVQLHHQDSTGYAFDIDVALPLHTWVQVVFAVDDTSVNIFYKYGTNMENRLHFVHDSEYFYYCDTDGYWVAGGTQGFPSFKGFMGHTRIYRRSFLMPEQVYVPPRDHPMFALGLDEHFAKCSRMTTKIYEVLYEEDERLAEQLLQEDRCMTRHKTLRGLIREEAKKPALELQCQAPKSGVSPEVEALVLGAMRNNSRGLEAAAESLYQMALHFLGENRDKAELSLSLLRVAGCTPHPTALYTLAVMLTTGLGRVHDHMQALKHLLIGASHNHAPSQLALGYKHFLGVDGTRGADCDVSIGYYKAAAKTADKLLQQHQDISTHAEAVRLDDYDELTNHRTSNSDLFRWIIHQASRGITDAQNVMGDLYYYGTRGVQRDLNRAVQYYEMGAEQGDPGGLFNLGVSALRGEGIEKNEEEAMRLIGLSADQGFGPALNAMGYYEVNTRQNYSGGTVYFRMAAEKGDRDGFFNLGVAYDNGWVPKEEKNKLTAFSYWFEAANRGHPGAILSVGEGVSSGEHVEKNCPLGIVYLRFLAEQHPANGRYLRRALEAYYDGNLYQSLVFFLLAGETGMELPQYNAALLCQENRDLSRALADGCAFRYYNSSAALGWVHSMLKLGDLYWYGWDAPPNLTAAAEMYSGATTKGELPQAVYNLAYMVEYNYSLEDVHWKDIYKDASLRGNLTFAANLYRDCRDSQENNNESFLPCAWGVVRVTLKQLWNDWRMRTLVYLIGALVSLGCLLYSIFAALLWRFVGRAG